MFQGIAIESEWSAVVEGPAAELKQRGPDHYVRLRPDVGLLLPVDTPNQLYLSVRVLFLRFHSEPEAFPSSTVSRWKGSRSGQQASDSKRWWRLQHTLRGLVWTGNQQLQ